jgi:ribosomal protein S18 acetylase RimI-like enzyme
MEFKTLENTSLDTILQVINTSYAGYVAPQFQLTKEKLELKITSEKIDLSISVGVFHNDVLVALMLHGSKNIEGRWCAYNTITGVLPTYRKQKLTVKMYDYILPILKEKGYVQIQLEAVTSNVSALKSYIEVGFTISRILECYKGKVKQLQSALDENITINNEWNFDTLTWIWDWEPTWQNDVLSIESVKQAVTCITYHDNGKVVGYLFFNNITNRVQQFAVAREYRSKHIASRLFYALAHHTGDQEVQVINLQAEVSGAKFLNRIGFELFIKQYEMKLSLV